MTTEPVLLVESRPRVLTVTLNRPAQRNTLTQQVLNELASALDLADRTPDCRVVVLQGRDGFFCTGMDFEELTTRAGAPLTTAPGDVHYMDVLRRMSSIGKVVISCVDGQAMAGGIGLLAASDLVLATPASRFSLPEALWGLLPACVLPLLIRRVGFHDAYRLTLTTETWDAAQAQQARLVDDVGDRLDDMVRRHVIRSARLDPATVARMKAYFKKMWYLSQAMEQVAVDEIESLVREPRIVDNIRTFMEQKTFPWERRES